MSDNGGHYSSQAFRNFAAEWCFDHVTSSPHLPQSNGFIERQVQTVKYTLKKAAMSRSNPQKALLALGSTPIDSHLPSPAEMLNARKYKSNLPVIIRNEHWSKDEIRRRLAERQEIQRLNHVSSYATTCTANTRTGRSCERHSDRHLAACQGDIN